MSTHLGGGATRHVPVTEPAQQSAKGASGSTTTSTTRQSTSTNPAPVPAALPASQQLQATLATAPAAPPAPAGPVPPVPQTTPTRLDYAGMLALRKQNGVVTPKPGWWTKLPGYLGRRFRLKLKLENTEAEIRWLLTQVQLIMSSHNTKGGGAKTELIANLMAYAATLIEEPCILVDAREPDGHSAERLGLRHFTDEEVARAMLTGQWHIDPFDPATITIRQAIMLDSLNFFDDPDAMFRILGRWRGDYDLKVIGTDVGKEKSHPIWANDVLPLFTKLHARNRVIGYDGSNTTGKELDELVFDLSQTPFFSHNLEQRSSDTGLASTLNSYREASVPFSTKIADHGILAIHGVQSGYERDEKIKQVVAASRLEPEQVFYVPFSTHFKRHDFANPADMPLAPRLVYAQMLLRACRSAFALERPKPIPTSFSPIDSQSTPALTAAATV